MKMIYIMKNHRVSDLNLEYLIWEMENGKPTSNKATIHCSPISMSTLFDLLPDCHMISAQTAFAAGLIGGAK